MPRIVEYSNELLSKKITSLQQCISNKEIVSTKNQLEKWEETNRQIDEKIDELTKLNDLVGGKIDDINKVLLDGKKFNKYRITHDELVHGKRLIFDLK